MSRDVASTIAYQQPRHVRCRSVPAATLPRRRQQSRPTKIENKVKNHFWETLEKNIKDILHETDKILPEGSIGDRDRALRPAGDDGNRRASRPGPVAARAGTAQQGIAGSPSPAMLQQTGTTVVKRTTFREAASVIVNPESGVVTVRATARQHEKVQEFLSPGARLGPPAGADRGDHRRGNAQRQLQQGIDWSRLRADSSGFSVSGTSAGATAVNALTPFTLAYQKENPLSQVLNLKLTLKLLETFGNVKVLSSPKLSVLNNQTAILKVVDDFVYFQVIQAEPDCDGECGHTDLRDHDTADRVGRPES